MKTISGNEYPRPQMVRDSFLSLDGLWQYKVLQGQTLIDSGNIQVPFPYECRINGQHPPLKKGQELRYHHRFSHCFNKPSVLLHFGAVDQICEVYLNGHLLGRHEGGYLSFSFEVSSYLKEDNELDVRVWDDTEDGIYSYGKQSSHPKGIFYTPISGIWQSVWMEEREEASFDNIKITPLYDEAKVLLEVEGSVPLWTVDIYENDTLLLHQSCAEQSVQIDLPHFIPWTPENPFLYKLILSSEQDQVESYFGMRLFSKEKDEQGYPRFCLNHKPYFIKGVLDQGYNMDGLYTYPEQKMLEEDLKLLKRCGFNTVRKHIKIECATFYALCDRLGLLVMQDLPSGGNHYKPIYLSFKGMLGIHQNDGCYAKTGRKNHRGRQFTYTEAQGMIAQLYNHPSIFAYVPFNEGWGQFDAREMVEWFKKHDNTRLIDHASGWFDQGEGDFMSAHVYFWTFKARKDKYERMVLLSECGGFGYFVKDHSYSAKGSGYRNYKDTASLSAEIAQMIHQLKEEEKHGLCGYIYTQLSDVETECNGLITYDRQLIKVNEEKLYQANQ